ncbi:5'-3' exonuclease PLD3-like isoform X2 [Protopterus annectens]|uniref:5'-3' exonuclease PLD3-like isoform X2 n=1 Tax=Protopterus annectens TaxID=7888 RepID=UPI001CF9BAA3|nr:5'-3' exonuclease PLD3-like isoform X2 [Protopterus annectens]
MATTSAKCPSESWQPRGDALATSTPIKIEPRESIHIYSPVQREEEISFLRQGIPSKSESTISEKTAIKRILSNPEPRIVQTTTEELLKTARMPAQQKRYLELQATPNTLFGRSSEGKRKPFFCRPLCFCLIPLIVVLAAYLWYLWEHGSGIHVLQVPGLLTFNRIFSFNPWWKREECSSQCSVHLVESIPVGLRYQADLPHHTSTYDAWMNLLRQANTSVDIAAFYFTLRDSDIYMEEETAWQGQNIFDKMMDLLSHDIKINIAVNSPQNSGDQDTTDLDKQGANIRHVELSQLTGGVVHTKLWVVDQKHIYIGSANMDWRSLTQVKELGVVVYNCSCLANDLEKIFKMYQYLGQDDVSLPSDWPAEYDADSSKDKPLKLQLNGTDASVYISSAPKSLCSKDRTWDQDAIISVIRDAKIFVYISVMDFIPMMRYSNPHRYWPVIDEELRAAACGRNVEVRLLISCWIHSYKKMFIFLQSLSILNRNPLHCNIKVRVFRVPSSAAEEKIPFARVNHNKYMVTDRVAYIGTSNWSEDYFTSTAGIALVVNETGSATEGETTVQSQLKAIFERDWSSNHAKNLTAEDNNVC